jgi:lysophospholipase L1-like esterase
MLLKKGQTIVFEGDSLTSRRRGRTLDTWAFLRMMNWQETYADEVERLLFCLRPELNLTFRNAAVGGSICRGMLDRLEPIVLPLAPDWVICTIGGNDAAREIPVAEFRKALSAYAERLRDECGGRMAFVSGFKPCPNGPAGIKERYARRPYYYRAQREVAEDYDGLFVDAGTPLQRKARTLYKQSDAHTVYSDGGHFNSVGNLIIAAEVIGALGIALPG